MTTENLTEEDAMTTGTSSGTSSDTSPTSGSRARRTTRAVAVAAGAALGAGALFAATPVLAGTGPGRTVARAAAAVGCPMWDDDVARGNGPRGGAGTNGSTGGSGYGYGMRAGTGMGMGRGMGMGGYGADPAAGLPAAGTLTAAQKTALAGMAEEEKLAHDVYAALASSTGDRRFTMIARSESRHLATVRVLLERYGVTDPTAGKADGQFASSSVQAQYGDLVAKGEASLDAALGVGRTIETTDIADLKTAGGGVTAADVTTVYQRLSAASQQHLAAFGG